MGAVSNDDIQWLISLVTAEGLAELEVTDEDRRVLVRRALPPPVAAAPLAVALPGAPCGPDTTGLVAVTAPMAGVFYRSSAPDSPPFVEEGDEVQAGETVALVEAMKLYNDVDAPCAGRIERILAADASRVAADQDIMYLRPLDAG